MMEPNVAQSSARISLPPIINLLLPLQSHLKYNVSYSIMFQKLINGSIQVNNLWYKDESVHH